MHRLLLLRTSKIYLRTEEKKVVWFKDYFESVWKEISLVDRRYLNKYWRSANTIEQRITNPVIELVQWDEVFYRTKNISACCESGNRLVFHIKGFQLAPADVVCASISSVLREAYYYSVKPEINRVESHGHHHFDNDMTSSSRSLVSNWLNDNVIEYTPSGIVWADKASL